MPTPPLSGLILWLKPETLPAGSYGDPITSWTDSSGAGHNFTSAVGTPTLVPSGTSGEIPGVKFSTSPSALSGPSFAINNNGSSVFFAYQTLQNATGPTGTDRVVVVRDGVSLSYTIIGNWSSYVPGSGPSALVSNSGSSTTSNSLFTPGVIGFVGSGSSGTWYVSDLTTTSTQTVATDGTTDIITGLGGESAGNILGGNLAEILIYNTPLSPSDATTVINYLNAKYNLFGPLTLNLSDTSSASDSMTDSFSIPLSDSTTASDSSPNSFSVQSSFLAPVVVPTVETLTNQLLPAETKVYYRIQE